MKSPWYLLTMTVVTVAWLALFVIGILVDSEPLRDALAHLLIGSPLQQPWLLVKAFAAVLATYTYTNICMLAMLASYLGGIAATVNIGPDGGAAALDRTYPRTSSLLRGFLIYLALLAGILIASDNAFAPSQSQYCKTAGFVSLTAFLCSLSPDLMKRLIDQFSSFIVQTARPPRFAGTPAQGRTGTPMQIAFRNVDLANQDVTFTIWRPDGTATTTAAARVGADGEATATWTPQVAGKHRVTHPTSADHVVDVKPAQ